jgi:hypothetical protein
LYEKEAKMEQIEIKINLDEKELKSKEELF